MRNLICCILVPFVFFSCKKKQDRPPVIETSKISSLADTIFCGAVLYSEGDARLSERGFCWSLNPEPTISDNRVICENGTGNYSIPITGLPGNMAYYVRAYATNSNGTAYGKTMKVRTYDGCVKDVDGNIYNTIKIGGKEWMASNLRVTKFNNGTKIPEITDNTAWEYILAPAFCYYNNNKSNDLSYGKLYNWYAVSSPNNLAPAGWHIPNNNELSQLFSAYNVDDLKFETWGTNKSGFSALPGGLRIPQGAFISFGSSIGFWSSTLDIYQNTSAIYMFLSDATDSGFTGDDFSTGYYIRCVKD